MWHWQNATAMMSVPFEYGAFRDHYRGLGTVARDVVVRLYTADYPTRVSRNSSTHESARPSRILPASSYLWLDAATSRAREEQEQEQGDDARHVPPAGTTKAT